MHTVSQSPNLYCQSLLKLISICPLVVTLCQRMLNLTICHALNTMKEVAIRVLHGIVTTQTANYTPPFKISVGCTSARIYDNRLTLDGVIAVVKDLVKFISTAVQLSSMKHSCCRDGRQLQALREPVPHQSTGTQQEPARRRARPTPSSLTQVQPVTGQRVHVERHDVRHPVADACDSPSQRSPAGEQHSHPAAASQLDPAPCSLGKARQCLQPAV